MKFVLCELRYVKKQHSKQQAGTEQFCYEEIIALLPGHIFWTDQK